MEQVPRASIVRVTPASVIAAGCAAVAWLLWTAHAWVGPAVAWGLLPTFVLRPLVRPIDLVVLLGLLAAVVIVPPVAAGIGIRRWWPIACLVLVVVPFLTVQPVGLWWSGSVYHRVHREELAQVSAFIDSGAFQDDPRRDEYYGVPLPESLAYLSATGKVSVADDGAVFLPVWTGIPDDAGGLFRSPVSPLGNDMYGMTCADPRDLGDGWWACGMPA